MSETGQTTPDTSRAEVSVQERATVAGNVVGLLARSEMPLPSTVIPGVDDQETTGQDVSSETKVADSPSNKGSVSITEAIKARPDITAGLARVREAMKRRPPIPRL